MLPLGFDTFAVAAALGIQGLAAAERLKATLLMSSFELTMPVVGLLLGHGLGTTIGGAAEYLAVAALLALGSFMLVAGERDDGEHVSALASRGGLALIGLGISISLDELAIGFTIGLLRLSIVLAVVLIGIQAFAVAQLGLRLGARLGEAAREAAEKLAAMTLIGLGVVILLEKLVV